jgi:hypothetical protein
VLSSSCAIRFLAVRRCRRGARAARRAGSGHPARVCSQEPGAGVPVVAGDDAGHQIRYSPIGVCDQERNADWRREYSNSGVPDAARTCSTVSFFLAGVRPAWWVSSCWTSSRMSVAHASGSLAMLRRAARSAPCRRCASCRRRWRIRTAGRSASAPACRAAIQRGLAFRELLREKARRLFEPVISWYSRAVVVGGRRRLVHRQATQASRARFPRAALV